MCPMIYYDVGKARREELLREAEKERLIEIARIGQPTLGERIQAKLGQMLKKTGNQFHISLARRTLKH